MYVVYHRSNFVTRFYESPESPETPESPKSPKENVRNVQLTFEKIIEQHNHYNNCKADENFKPLKPYKLEDCRVLEESKQYTGPTNLIRIGLFNEFKHLKNLKKRISDLPYPKGLQIEISQSRKPMSDNNSDHLTIYQNNIKLFFDEKNDDNVILAKGIAKWLMLDPKQFNSRCINVLHDRIIMETVSVDTVDNTKLSKKDRWGELYIPPSKPQISSVDIDSQIGRFTDKIYISVFKQFKWMNYIEQIVQGPTITIGHQCEFDFIGENNIKLYYYERGCDDVESQGMILRHFYAFLQKHLPPHIKVIEEFNGIMNCDGSSYYQIILTVTKAPKAPEKYSMNELAHMGSFKINNLDELDKILADEDEIDDEQNEIKIFYAKELSKIPD